MWEWNDPVPPPASLTQQGEHRVAGPWKQQGALGKREVASAWAWMEALELQLARSKTSVVLKGSSWGHSPPPLGSPDRMEVAVLFISAEPVSTLTGLGSHSSPACVTSWAALWHPGVSD